MHELGVTQSMLDIVIAQAEAVQAKKIARVNLVIGEMSNIVGDCLQFYFDFLSRDTIASGAILSMQRVPSQFRCRNCGTVFSPNGSHWSCPNCQQWNVEVATGQEFYIDSIEVE